MHEVVPRFCQLIDILDEVALIAWQRRGYAPSTLFFRLNYPPIGKGGILKSIGDSQ
ncbi:unnamed protein product [marine sediment metagenome]|uniref:Uncharacterized protein n=1 Tax=marine sediment metagenome TaxID=412755 RepID=X1QQM1_9ZZZZ